MTVRSSANVVAQVLLGGICCGAMLACGTDDPDTAGPPVSEKIPNDDCGGRAEQFSAGMAKVSAGGWTVELVDANPAPPRQGDNTWTLALRDESGAAIEGANVALELWMPDHNHGSNKEPTTVELGDGRYQLAPVFLSMPGLWEIGVRVATERTERVSFAFCAPGS